MNHNDIYSALGLDRSADCSSLSREIDRRINATDPSGAQAGELRAARAVLGDPYRRGLYDRQLADPAAPPITLRAISELAELPVPSNAGRTAPAPATAQARAGGSQRDLPNSRSLWIAVGAVAVVAAAVVGGFAVGSHDNGTSAEPMGEHTVAAADAETPSPEIAGNDSPSPTAAPMQEEIPQRDLASGVRITTREWLDEGGFAGDGVPGPRCDRETEEWIFAASNGTDRILICETQSEMMTYYGWYNGNRGERPIDKAKSGVGHFFTTGEDYISGKTSDLVFDIDGDRLIVKNPNTYEEKSRRNFTWSCDRRDTSCEFYNSSL